MLLSAGAAHEDLGDTRDVGVSLERALVNVLAYAKLDTHTRGEAVTRARRLGLLAPPGRHPAPVQCIA